MSAAEKLEPRKKITKEEIEELERKFEEDFPDLYEEEAKIKKEQNRKVKNLKINRNRVLRKRVFNVALAGTLLCTLAGKPLYNCINNGTFVYNVSNENNKYSKKEFLNKFKSAFNANESLKNSFDDVLPELCDFVECYGEYLNQQEILSNIKTLEVKVLDNDDPQAKKLGDSTVAAYIYTSNEIDLKSNIAYKKFEEQREIKYHEFLHFLLRHEYHTSGKSALDEGTVSLITRESGLYANVDIYEKDTYYVRAICELIGSDNYMKAMGDHDYNELVDYMSEYTSESKAIKLLKNIEEACLDYNKKGTDADLIAFDIINEMYINKHGYSIDDSDDQVMRCYSNKTADTTYDITGARSYYQVTVNKNYLIETDRPATLVYEKYKLIYGEGYLDENNSVTSGVVLKDGYYDEDGNVVDDKGNFIVEEKEEFKVKTR